MIIPFINCGLTFGHLFFLPWFDRALYDEFHMWPYFTLLFSIVGTASIISVIKLSEGKYIFEHFVYLFIASLLFLTSGILFIVLNIECKYSICDTFAKNVNYSCRHLLIFYCESNSSFFKLRFRRKKYFCHYAKT